MKKFALPALAAALALAACDSTPEADDTMADDTMAADATATDTTMAAPTATETVTVDTGATPTGTATAMTDGTNVTIDGSDVDATVGENGVKATVKVD